MFRFDFPRCKIDAKQITVNEIVFAFYSFENKLKQSNYRMNSRFKKFEVKFNSRLSLI